VKFTMRISRPNSGSAGEICLDSLKPDPPGTWKPSANLAMVLTQIRLLIRETNIGDPLDAHTADELRERRCAEDEAVRIPSNEDEA
jgi:ubiquitin-conjugating enzyme E2 T